MTVNFNTPEKQIIVDIRGAVNNPGLYALKWGQSIEDAVGHAGGLTADAVAGSDLLASIPDNLDYIYIPSKNDGPQKVNINYAEQWLLEALPGIGAAKAKAIMDYRTNNGYFTSVSELKKVSGIGDTIFNQIKDRITI
ncbi:MAG: helix-hairpin-helix domain-containing protein [Chloroflexi bacterium]|nr:helix-hairpin-helix domain-containing protein [Chloroflexota bacterium]